MRITHRPFDASGPDFERMWRFLQQDYADRRDRFIWLFSRLGDWKYGLWNDRKLFPTFFEKYAELWVDAFERPAGFVVSEDGGDIFFIFTALGFDYLYAEILDWTMRHWGPRYERLRAEVHEYQADALAELERRGFRSLGAVATTREYDLRGLPDEPARLDARFHVVNMAENGDYLRKELLYRNGFEGVEQVSEFDRLRFEYSRLNPAYDAQFDLSVVTGDGTHVATCVGFNDPALGVAEVEKVCTHSQFRRMGLAEAVIRECFRRLRQRGIHTAYITAYGREADALYEKLGPVKRRRWFHYEMAA